MSGPELPEGPDFAEGETKCGASSMQLKEDEVASEGALAARVSASYSLERRKRLTMHVARACTAFSAVLRHVERKKGCPVHPDKAVNASPSSAVQPS